MDFYSIVKKKRDPKTHENVLTFPTLCACSGCGGYTGYYDGGFVSDPETAFKIALIQFGYVTCRHYDNLPPTHACNCAAALKELSKWFSALPTLDAGEWKSCGGIPHRGITDFTRTLKFERDLAADELELLCEYLQRNKCPGWTGVRIRKASAGEYVATTTWDSSD